MRLSLLVASMVLFNTSCFMTYFSLIAAAARLFEVPFEGFHIATVLLELIVEGKMSGFLAGG